MKCTSKTTVRVPVSDTVKFVRYEDREKVCNGEMMEVGDIPRGEINSPTNDKLFVVSRKLYQCEQCKTIKIV